MSTEPIASYSYRYGPINTDNRKVEFYQKEGRIFGEEFGFENGSWKQVTRIEESQMEKEALSASEKTKIYLEEMGKGAPEEPSKSTVFLDLSPQKKIEILEALGYGKKYDVAITSTRKMGCFFEQITKLLFVDNS